MREKSAKLLAFLLFFTVLGISPAKAERTLELAGIEGVSRSVLFGSDSVKAGGTATYRWVFNFEGLDPILSLQDSLVYDRYARRNIRLLSIRAIWIVETVWIHCAKSSQFGADIRESIGRSISKTRIHFVGPYSKPAVNTYDWAIDEKESLLSFSPSAKCAGIVVSSVTNVHLNGQIPGATAPFDQNNIWLFNESSDFVLFQQAMGSKQTPATKRSTQESTPSAASNSPRRPRCSANDLAKYKKAVRQEEEAWIEFRYALDSAERYKELTGKYPKDKLERLSYRNWLTYGYALEKYAKICKMKMRTEWYEMKDSLPVD